MFSFFNNVRVQSLFISSRRFIVDLAQFRRPKDDCCPRPPIRKILDPKECKVRDNGLVLGVYANEDIPNEPPTLTNSASLYDGAVQGKLLDLLKLSRFPRLGEVRIFYDLEKTFAYVAVAGLGNECTMPDNLENRDEHREAVRIAASAGASALQQLAPGSIEVETFGDAEAAAEGSNLAIWEFRTFKSRTILEYIPSKLKMYDNRVKGLMDNKTNQIECDQDLWTLGETKAESQNLVRFLQEMPANILTPLQFATTTVDLLCELGINVHIMTKDWAAMNQMGGFDALGNSSVQVPLFIELSYYGDKGVKFGDPCEAPIVLIGKGVTFNSGGIQLKSYEDLKHMRGDMAGAACVIAAVRAAALLKLKVNIKGILPVCEIMPNGLSPKFLDIVNCGDTTILLRTPAREGRILLADSLRYAHTKSPKYVIDVGTMSEQLLYTLGGSASGCYSNSEELYCLMNEASKRSGDRVWRMPLWKHYLRLIKNTTEADLANTAEGPFADSPVCAALLNQFSSNTKTPFKWLHLDTYNVAYTKGHEIPYLKKGMTGRPVRTLIEFFYQNLRNQIDE